MKLLTPLLIAVMSSAAFGQTLQEKVSRFEKPKFYHVRYDKFKDQTVVGFIAPKVKPLGFGFSIAAISKGEKVGGETGYWVTFMYMTRNTLNPNFKTHEAILMADDQRIMLDKGDPDSAFNRSIFGTNWYFTESLTFKVSRPDFEKLAKANTIEFQISGFEGSLESSTIAAFRNMLSLEQ